jgi:hypothetical protein
MIKSSSIVEHINLCLHDSWYRDYSPYHSMIYPLSGKMSEELDINISVKLFMDVFNELDDCSNELYIPLL